MRGVAVRVFVRLRGSARCGHVALILGRVGTWWLEVAPTHVHASHVKVGQCGSRCVIHSITGWHGEAAGRTLVRVQVGIVLLRAAQEDVLGERAAR